MALAQGDDLAASYADDGAHACGMHARQRASCVDYAAML